jgi:hypothetical protein
LKQFTVVKTKTDRLGNLTWSSHMGVVTLSCG